MKPFCFAILILVAVALSLFAQAPQTATQTQTQSQPSVPATDIYLLDLIVVDGSVQLRNPVNITNHAGYDNQPFFLPDRPSILFTSIRKGEQADIYEYNWETKSLTRRTNTPESEFSPTPLPNGFSVVRVEKDQTQRLWKFPWNGDSPSLLLENIKPVGYHSWIDATRVVLFVLGEPPNLQLADVQSGKAEILEKNIGRSLHKIPGTKKASFVHKVSDQDWRIKSIDIETLQISEIAPTLSQSEDYVWMPPSQLLMAKDSKIYIRQPGSEWKEIADLQPEGIRGITRIAISPKNDRIAIVALEK